MIKTGVLWFLEYMLLLALAPLLPGIINRVKAFFAGRKGPPVTQLYRDLAKLFRKGAVFSVTSGGVLQLAPAVIVVSTVSAGIFLPAGGTASPLAFFCDGVFFFYLLGLGRIAGVMAALDTGSSFEGMGASREMQFAALIEPAVMLMAAFPALWLSSGSFSLSGVAAAHASGHPVSVMLIVIAFFIVLAAENCRVPVDDPDTHLELTMIHEAMILDYSGPDLGMILYASAVKLALFASFTALLVMSALPEMGVVLRGAVFFGIMLLTAAVVGILESCMARYRLLKIPQMLAGAAAAVLLAVGFRLLFEGGLN